MRPKPPSPLSLRATVLLVAAVALLTLYSGWQRELARRYPVSDLPRVNRARIAEQLRGGNLTRTEALFSREVHAGSDTAENR